jgi:hypothetical protein
MRSWRRPLEPSEVSWILEGKIRGTIPVRMFPRPTCDSKQCSCCAPLAAGTRKAVDGANEVQKTPSAESVASSQ